MNDPLVSCQQLWYQRRSSPSNTLRVIHGLLGERKALTTSESLLADISWSIEPGTHWFLYSRQPEMQSAVSALLMGLPGAIQGQRQCAYSRVIHFDALMRQYQHSITTSSSLSQWASLHEVHTLLKTWAAPLQLAPESPFSHQPLHHGPPHHEPRHREHYHRELHHHEPHQTSPVIAALCWLLLARPHHPMVPGEDRQLLIIHETSLTHLTQQAPELVTAVCQQLQQASSSLIVLGQHPDKVPPTIQSLIWCESNRMITQGSRARFSDIMHHPDFPPTGSSAWHKRAFIQQCFPYFDATQHDSCTSTTQHDGETNNDDATQSWQVREGTTLPLAEVLALFEASFGHALSAPTWCWKYRETQNAGTLVYDYGNTPGAINADQSPRLVAFNGGMPRQIQVDQKAFTAVQMGDVMVHPQYRGILTRKGPFYLAVSHYFSTRIGSGKPYPYTFGFPNKRHAILGKKRGLYCDIDVILDVRWPTSQRYNSLIERGLMRRATLHDTPIMARLWQAMSSHLADAAVGTRDPGWIISRYLEKPDGAYQLWLVFSPWHHQAIGMIVLQPSDSHTMELLDIVSTPTQTYRLIRAAQHLSAKQGFQCLYSWMTPTALSWFEASAPQVNTTDIVIPGSAVGGSQQAAQLRNRWWLMGGDTDFH